MKCIYVSLYGLYCSSLVYIISCRYVIMLHICRCYCKRFSFLAVVSMQNHSSNTTDFPCSYTFLCSIVCLSVCLSSLCYICDSCFRYHLTSTLMVSSDTLCGGVTPQTHGKRRFMGSGPQSKHLIANCSNSAVCQITLVLFVIIIIVSLVVGSEGLKTRVIVIITIFDVVIGIPSTRC